MDERELRAILRFAVDQASVQKTARASDQLGQQIEQDADDVAKSLLAVAAEMKRVQDQADLVSRKMGLLRDAADIGGEIAEGFAAAGAALSGTLLLSINSYLQSAGTAEATSRRWQSATDNLARSQQRVGRVAAESILPVLEDAARLADRAARFAEKNPDIVGAALKIGTVTAALGAVGVAVSRGIRLIADTKQLVYETMALKAAQIQAAAADKQLVAAGINAKATTGGVVGAAGSALLKPLIPGAAAAAGGTLAARTAMATGAKAATLFGVPLTAAGGVTGAGLLAAVSPLTLAGGLGLGGLGYNAIQRSQWGQQRGLASLGQYASVAAYGAGSLFGQGNEWFQAVAEFTGELQKTSEAAQNATTALSRVGGGGALADTRAGQAARVIQTEESLQAQKQLSEEMQSVWDQYYQQQVEAERSWARQAEDVAIETARRQEDIAREVAQQKLEIAQQYNQAMAAAEAAYDQARASAQRAYANARRQAAESHADQLKDIEENYQRSIREIEESYQTTLEDAIIARDATAVYRAQRQREEQLQDARENRDEQRAEADENYQEQLEQARENYQEQLTAAREALEQQREAAREARKEALREMQEQLAQQAEEQRIADQRRMEDENLARQRETQDQKRWLDAQLSQLRGEYSSEYSSATSHYARMLSAAQSYYSRMSNLSSSGSPLGRHEYNGIGGYAAGGYTGAGGISLLHANEFVLAASTTRQLEEALGPLTQERVGALASSGPTVSISMQNAFSGVSAGDERALAQWAAQVKNETLRAVSDALTG